MEELKQQLKEFIISELFLDDITPEEIENNAPLFGEGLGLDSLDAVELVVLLRKEYNIDIKNMDEGKIAFRSIDSLAEYIQQHGNG